ncbi:MAG: 2OG-Fe(II) oxygenase, partial [Cyclobacteriaceae bacterium]
MENSFLVNHQKNEQVVRDLYTKGWAVIDDYFPKDFVLKLLKEQEDLMYHGQFRLAGIGKGENFSIKPEIRSDKVLWLDRDLLTPLQTNYWQCMEELRNAINRRCYLGLKSFEAHFSMYPPGSFYLRHLDQFQAV